MIRLSAGLSIGISALFLLHTAGCSKKPVENPFQYTFIKPLHLKQVPDKPYSGFKAFYVLTEDFEPLSESALDLEAIRDVLKFASDLSAQYHVPWTHFVDVNALYPAFFADDPQLKLEGLGMISDLTRMSVAQDDIELHLHGPLNRQLLDYVRAEEKLRIKTSGADESQPYRQRRSFFFQSYYHEGYRELVASLSYGKKLLERHLLDDKKQILAFRPGGWDHGDTEQDTLLYFHALSDSGLIANSGLATGKFGTADWRVGGDPGHNFASVTLGDHRITEISPTAGPGGYVNPVLPNDFAKLANATKDEMPIIVSVYHLSALQKTKADAAKPPRSEADLQLERETLARHFKTVADLTAARVLYPITIRDLLTIISDQQPDQASSK